MNQGGGHQGGQGDVVDNNPLMLGENPQDIQEELPLQNDQAQGGGHHGGQGDAADNPPLMLELAVLGGNANGGEQHVPVGQPKNGQPDNHIQVNEEEHLERRKIYEEKTGKIIQWSGDAVTTVYYVLCSWAISKLHPTSTDDDKHKKVGWVVLTINCATVLNALLTQYAAHMKSWRFWGVMVQLILWSLALFSANVIGTFSYDPYKLFFGSCTIRGLMLGSSLPGWIWWNVTKEMEHYQEGNAEDNLAIR